jgi:cell division protein FtsB
MNADLERRIAALSDEIRHYPQPIARCDEQLAGLIAERDALIARLKALQEGPCGADALWANDGGSNAA